MGDIPYFSIIVPTHKRPKMLKNALDSLSNQIFKNFEIVVVIDGSAEGYENTFKEYNSLRLEVFNISEAKGVSFARNHGVMNAIGDWLIFLDDDDELSPRCLEERYLNIKRHNESENFFSWCNVKHVKLDPSGQVEDVGFSQFKSEYISDGHLFADTFKVGAGYALCVSRNVFTKLGGFNQKYKVGEDTDFIFRLLANGYRPAINLAIGVIVYHHHTDKLTKIMSNRSTLGVVDSLLIDHEHLLNQYLHLKITVLSWAAKTHYEASAFEAGDKIFKLMVQLAVVEAEYLRWCKEVAMYRKHLHEKSVPVQN